MININASFIVVFLIVWILVFVLSRLFFRPLRKVVKERQDRIQGNRDAHQKSMEAFEQALAEIESKIKSANTQAQKIKENLEREALKERERILTEISTECRSQVEKAKERLEKQAEDLKRELETETSRLAKRIEQKLLN